MWEGGVGKLRQTCSEVVDRRADVDLWRVINKMIVQNVTENVLFSHSNSVHMLLNCASLQNAGLMSAGMVSDFSIHALTNSRGENAQSRMSM